MAFHNFPLKRLKIGACQAWHAIIAVGQHTQLDNFGCGMSSYPEESTHGQTTLGMACHHPPVLHTHRQYHAWHAIIALGQHSQPDDVGCSLISWTFEFTESRTSGVAFCTRPWKSHTIGRRRVLHAIMDPDNIDGRMTSDLACPCSHCITQIVGRRRAWNAIIEFE